MAKIKFDVSDVESESGGGPQPKPGMYYGKILEVNEKTSSSGNEMLEIKLEITTTSAGKKTEFKGAHVYTYIVQDEKSAWKMREFLEAVGLVKGKKARGVLDTAKIAGTEVQIQIKPDQYDGEYKARVGKLLPLADDTVDDEDDEDLDDEEPEDEDEDELDYSEMSTAELKEEAEERELEIPKKKGVALKKALIALLEEDDEEGDDEDDEDEDDEDDDKSADVYDADELAELANDELKDIAEGLDLKVPARLSAPAKKKLIAAIVEAQEAGDDDDDEDEDEDEGDEEDYDTWEVDDLKAELRERELKTTGSKKLLVARLKKDDESSEDPF